MITGLVTVNMDAGEALNMHGRRIPLHRGRNTLGVNGLVMLSAPVSVTIEDSRFMTNTPQGGAAGGGRALVAPASSPAHCGWDDNFFGGATTTDPVTQGGANILPQFGGAS